jgi:hypothetical protein
MRDVRATFTQLALVDTPVNGYDTKVRSVVSSGLSLPRVYHIMPISRGDIEPLLGVLLPFDFFKTSSSMLFEVRS